MSENKISEQSEHHAGDEAELDRLESNLDGAETRDTEVSPEKKPFLAWIITAAIVFFVPNAKA